VQAVAAGRATYDASSAGACLSFIATASCDVLEAFTERKYPQAGCAAAIAGKLADGEACYSHDSCATGVCLLDYSCPATCATPVPSGSPCDYVRPCAAGNACNILLPTPACVPLSQLNGLCLNDNWCGPGLFCEFVSYYENGCRQRATSGSCTRDEECAIGYRCSSADTCVAWLAPGAACAQGENACGPGLWCGSGGTCIDGPAPSQACQDVNGEARPCIGGFCEPGGTGAFCTAWGAPGDACLLSSECGPTDYCDIADTRVCTTFCAEP
jgi:hypothetical protein